MEIPVHIKRFAKKEGFPDVDYLGKWERFELYSAFSEKAPFVGLPQYILSDSKETRWASLNETEEIMESRAISS